jgi:hypothetical protein
MTLSLNRQVHVIQCHVVGHHWKLQQLRRGKNRVEMCTRCGALEPYLDIFTELPS